MQFNYNNNPISKRPPFKKKIINFFLFFLASLLVIFLLSKFNFPSPEKEVIKKITNEIIKLK